MSTRRPFEQLELSAPLRNCEGHRLTSSPPLFQTTRTAIIFHKCGTGIIFSYRPETMIPLPLHSENILSRVPNSENILCCSHS